MSMRPTTRMILIAIYVFLVTGTTAVLVRAQYARFQAGYGRLRVTEGSIRDLGAYPVVVVRPTGEGGKCTAAVVSMQYGISEYMRDHPGCQFLVPKGKSDDLNSQLAEESRRRDLPADELRVVSLVDGRQSIRATLRWHGGLNADTAWYIAERWRIIPQYASSYQAVPVVAGSAVLASAANGAVLAAVCVLWRRKRRRG